MMLPEDTKLLVMCEGTNEKTVMEMLVDYGCLTFSRDDLLNLQVFHARQIDKSTAVKTALNLYSGKVKVIRIGDALTDRLDIPKDYRDRVDADSIEKYCTKPELEILLIISEGLESEFDKVKGGKKRTSPKDFCKKNIMYNKMRYDNSSEFYMDYYGDDINKLVNAIKRYKSIHKQGKEVLYLADLLK